MDTDISLHLVYSCFKGLPLVHTLSWPLTEFYKLLYLLMQRSVELRKRAKENVRPDLARELDKYLQAMQHSQVCGDHMYVFGMAKCRVDYVCIYV